MTSREIRQKFLDFYKEKGHTIIPSASIVPENDSTLLFVNSGMFPLVPYLLGETHPGGKRLANSQKCFRAEDIEEVGDNRHNTFFEMLGNWSLGDYFKEDQLNWWYEFLVEKIKLDPNRLYQTVYVGDKLIGGAGKDEDSINIVKRIFKKYGVEAEIGPDTSGDGEKGPGMPIDFSKVHIMAYRDKNWWKRGDAIGELGGPDSETFYDTGKKHDPKFGEHCHLNCDCGKFIEIGNSVFMSYRKAENSWEVIDNRNVDFGGGLERLLMAENGKSNIFETDLFEPIIKKLEELSGKKYSDDSRSFEIIADHLKAATFIMGDKRGLTPSNIGQGYIVRRLIRRAVRYGRQIGITEPGWTKSVVPVVLGIYEGIYPELEENKLFVITELEKEEEKFAKTLENGLREVRKLFNLYRSLKTVSKNTISGKALFNLFQTYGIPLEMALEELENLSNVFKQPLNYDKGLITKEFEKELNLHQELSRTASAGMFKGGLADSSEETTKLHTAAHLLLASLRKVLGDHVCQKGSNITSERLRFDFSHPEKMTADQIAEAEAIVNGWIKLGLPVTAEEMDVGAAKKSGAMGVFDDRYGDKVKVYSIGKEGEVSKEICGGPHISNTSELGHFRITKEQSASSGVRRIKAILE